jgi:hypothetical protein
MSPNRHCEVRSNPYIGKAALYSLKIASYLAMTGLYFLKTPINTHVFVIRVIKVTHLLTFANLHIYSFAHLVPSYIITSTFAS